MNALKMVLRHVVQAKINRKVSVAILTQTMWTNAYSTLKSLSGLTPPKTTTSAHRKCLTHQYFHMCALTCRRCAFLHRATVWLKAIRLTLRKAVRLTIHGCFLRVNMRTNKSFSKYVAERAMITILLIYLLLSRMPQWSVPRVILGKRLREVQCHMGTTRHLSG